MKKYWILVGTAIILGIFALIIGNPTQAEESEKSGMSFDVVLKNKMYGKTVYEIADWIIKKKQDYKLVDIRDDTLYQKGAIPTAMNIPKKEFGPAYFDKSDKIVIYCKTDSSSVDAMLQLRNNDFNAVYVIYGGYNAWEDKILNPVLADNASEEEIEEFKKIREISFYFGGNPKGLDSEDMQREVKAPKLQMPSQPAQKKKRGVKSGGC